MPKTAKKTATDNRRSNGVKLSSSRPNLTLQAIGGSKGGVFLRAGGYTENDNRQSYKKKLAAPRV